MPVGGFERGERPAHAFAGEAGQNVIVMENVSRIVEMNEAEIEAAAINQKRRQRQNDADAQRQTVAPWDGSIMADDVARTGSFLLG